MGILALDLEKIGTTAHPPLFNMWASLITLTFVAILGHSSAFGIHQPLPWTTYDTSSLLHSQKQCVQQVIDADSLLKIITKIVDDIPNICLSKFKMCGGFETPSPYPPPPMTYPPKKKSLKKSSKMETEPKLRLEKLVNVGQHPDTEVMATVTPDMEAMVMADMENSVMEV